ncbi:hypothetical protein AMI01nite_23460 [Aneurinibacillus migulanus]|nr:hypothetical protein AMI01nite_23460 [Aneurinibacillus migulanus]
MRCSKVSFKQINHLTLKLTRKTNKTDAIIKRKIYKKENLYGFRKTQENKQKDFYGVRYIYCINYCPICSFA